MEATDSTHNIDWGKMTPKEELELLDKQLEIIHKHFLMLIDIIGAGIICCMSILIMFVLGII